LYISLGLSQNNYSDDSIDLLDLVLYNFAEFIVIPADSGIVQLDHYILCIIDYILLI
jgi:hypothetical protein